MTGNRQQQTHTKQLLAGVPMNIDQPCEFVFIDQGEDLDFVVGDSRLSGRKAGDFARFDRPVESVRVVSPYDQTVKLVLGFGEFSRLIVSGELNVSSYVTTGRGENLSLPMDVTKRVGLVDGVSITVEDATVNLTDGGSIADAGTRDPFLFWYQGSFWRAYHNALVRYADDFQSIAETRSYTSVPAEIQDSDWVGGGATEGGRVYFWAKNASNRVVVYTFDIDELIVTEITNSDMPNESTNWSVDRKAAGVMGTRIYYWIDPSNTNANSGNRGKFAYYDFASGNAGHIDMTWGNGPDYAEYSSNTSRGSYSFIDPAGYLCVGLDQGSGFGAYPSNSYARYTPDGVFVDVKQFLFPIGSTNIGNHQTLAISGDGRYVALSGSGERVFYMENRTTYGELYVQDGSDTATRRTRILTEPLAAVPIADGKYTVTSGLVRSVMSLLRGDFNPAGADYLDWLTAIGFTDRYGVPRRYDSGTKTLFGRGITDENMPIVIEGDLTLGILPEFFDQ